MIMKIVLYVYKYIFINILKWNVGGGLMNIWLRLQQTLYTKCISESVFGLLSPFWFCFLLLSFFCCAKIPAWCWFCCFLVSCYRLAKARPKVWRPPRLSPRRRSDLPRRAVWQTAAGARRARPADAAVAGRERGSPSSRLSPGDVPLCGSETPLCWAVCSAQVWTLVSRPCITLYLSSAEGWGGGAYVGMNSLCCLFFCPTLHARMMLTLTVCTWMWHLLSWYFIKACLGWTCPFALRNVGIHLFISNTAEACRSFFPSLVFYYINCPPLKCTKSFSLLYIVC